MRRDKLSIHSVNNKKMKDAMIKAAALQRQEEKNKRQVKKIGKMPMTKIWAKPLEKKEEKKEELTEEQKDIR